jgi:hypothetical protein
MKLRFGIVVALLAVLVVGANVGTSVAQAQAIIGGGVWGDAKHSGGGATHAGPGDIVTGALAGYSTGGVDLRLAREQALQHLQFDGRHRCRLCRYLQQRHHWSDCPGDRGGNHLPRRQRHRLHGQDLVRRHGQRLRLHGEATIANRPLLLASGGIGSNVTAQFTTTASASPSRRRAVGRSTPH